MITKQKKSHYDKGAKGYRLSVKKKFSVKRKILFYTKSIIFYKCIMLARGINLVTLKKSLFWDLFLAEKSVFREKGKKSLGKHRKKFQ